VAADFFLRRGDAPRPLPLALSPAPAPVPERPPLAERASALSVVADERDDLLSLVLVGDLDAYTTPGFHEHARRYDPAEVQLVVDLAGVRLLDSAGLSALVSLRNRAHRESSRIGIVCPDREMARLFWFTGLRPAFAFGSDLAAVRAELAGPSAPGDRELEAP
jgi:anti-anti-sigma factor